MGCVLLWINYKRGSAPNGQVGTAYNNNSYYRRQGAIMSILLGGKVANIK